ncbi:MAG: (Fe-S)-binding protein [Promethearchaeia archaeon]
MTETKKKNKKAIESHEIIQKVRSCANYCFNCNRCVNVCPLAHLGIFSPRQLIDDIIYHSVEEALEKNNIWQCLTCGQCSVYCPMTKDEEGVQIPELILELRKLALKEGIDEELEKVAQCETHDGIFPLIADIMAKSPNPPNQLGFIRDNDLKIQDSGEIGLFLGPAPFMDEVLFNFEVNFLKAPITIISLMNESEISPVVLNEKLSGHDILWGRGDVKNFKKLARYNVDLFRKAGVKTVVVIDAEDYRTWKIDYPKIIEDFDFEVLHYSEFFLKHHILEHVRFPKEDPIKVTYHDSCRIGRLGPKLYDAPRQLIKQIPGVKLLEMEHIKEDASCCGVSAFSCCNEFTRQLRKQRIIEAVQTAAEILLVPCIKCLSHFNCYLSEPALSKDQKELKEKIKIMDLATFIGSRLFL